MKKDLENMLKSEKLVETIKRLREHLKEKEDMLDKIRDNCRHKVVVITERVMVGGEVTRAIRSKRCLFCDSDSNSVLVNAEIIDMSNAGELLPEQYKMEIVKVLFFVAVNENPNLNVKQVVELVQKMIDNRETIYKDIERVAYDRYDKGL